MKLVVGINQGSYTFNASARTITLVGLVTIKIEEIISIINTTNNILLYDGLKATGTISSNVITLNMDTSKMINTDVLQIILEVPNDTLFITESFTTTNNTLVNCRPVNGDFNTRFRTQTKIVFKNTGSHNANINVLGSVDNGTNFDDSILASVQLANGATQVVTVTSICTNIRVLACDKVNGQHTTIQTRAYSF